MPDKDEDDGRVHGANSRSPGGIPGWYHVKAPRLNAVRHLPASSARQGGYWWYRVIPGHNLTAANFLHEAYFLFLVPRIACV